MAAKESAQNCAECLEFLFCWLDLWFTVVIFVKRPDSSDSASVKLMSPLAIPILDFNKVLSALTPPPTIPTPTPSPVKTSL